MDSNGWLSEASATNRLELVQKPGDVVKNPFSDLFLEDSNLLLTSDVCWQSIPSRGAPCEKAVLGEYKISVRDEYSSCPSVIFQLESKVFRFIILPDFEYSYHGMVDYQLVDSHPFNSVKHS